LQDEEGSPDLTIYDGRYEDRKAEVFEALAALTTTRGAIAETGSLILWPNEAEPRLLSLVPPLHIALLDADRIYDTLWWTLTEENWQDGMPTNVVLISGPSKTADIEQELTFGVHGPKELIVLVIDG
jgi:L-lactate dehydrogenase complex protein LldG